MNYKTFTQGLKEGSKVNIRTLNNQHYALIYTTPLFYIYTGSNMFRQPENTTDGTTTLLHIGHVTTNYMV
jgi:hypothetical protein